MGDTMLGGGVRRLTGVRMYATVPVNQVTRIFRFQLADGAEEEGAVALDRVITEELLPIFREVPGFVKMVRKVCKEQWTYEGSVVLEAAEFGNYMESSVRADKVEPILAKV